MANRESRCGQVSTRLCEVGAELANVLADGQVTLREMAHLQRILGEVELCADEIEAVTYDIAKASQILHIGRERSAREPHLRAKIVNLDAARAARAKRLATLEPSQGA